MDRYLSTNLVAYVNKGEPGRDVRERVLTRAEALDCPLLGQLRLSTWTRRSCGKGTTHLLRRRYCAEHGIIVDEDDPSVRHGAVRAHPHMSSRQLRTDGDGALVDGKVVENAHHKSYA